MPIDPNILTQASKAYAIHPQQDPLESYAKALTLKNAMGQNTLQDLQTKTAQQGLDDDQAVRSAYQSSGGDQAALRANLVTRGLYKQVQALDKAKLEDDAKRAGIDKDKSATKESDLKRAKEHLDITGRVFGYVKDNPTVENAQRAVDQLLQSGVIDAPSAQQMKLTIPNDPNAIRQAATQNFQNALSGKDQLQKFETRNIGGQTQTVGINPVSGQTGVVNTVQNTQSPDSIASNATTQRGQNMTDSRSRDANANMQNNNQVNIEGKIRDDYNAQAKNFVAVRDAQQRVLASAKDPSAAGDLSLIFNYMKVLDPNSTVREGEFATAQNSGSIPERLRAQYNKAANGERLSQGIRDDFVNRATRLYQDAETNQAKIEQQYSDIATRSGARPENVVTPQRVTESQAPAASAPTRVSSLSQADPAKYNGQVATGDDGVKYRSDGKRWLRVR